MRRVITLICLTVFFGNAAICQDLRSYIVDEYLAEREHQVDVTHLKLEASFVPKRGEVIGTVTHTIVPLRSTIDTLFFDAPGINIKSVKLDKSEVKYYTNSKGVVVQFEKPITWGKSHNIEIQYTATPKKGLYFIGWNSPEHKDPRNMTRRQLWTQGQGIDNRHWIPMYDDMNDKYTTEMIISFDSAYKVLSNGELLNVKEKKGNKTWHYKLSKPHPGYLMMLAIDKFAVKKTKTKSGTPVQFWYYPEHPEKLEPTSRYTEQIIEFFEQKTGIPYAWGTYSQVMVQDFMYGAMENTSATIFGDFFFVDSRAFLDRNYINVNAHELAHQWFGDLITARSSSDAWLQESFATYYAKLFFGVYAGQDELKWSQISEVKRALNAAKKDNYPVRHSKSGSSRIYQKGSSILQMLSYVMGEEHYDKAINLYLNRHAFKNVETADLQKAIVDATGMNMSWFFEQWIHHGGEPHYEISWVKVDGGTRISVDQIHKINETTGLFRMPIKFAVYYEDGTIERKTEWIEKQHEVVTIENKEDKKVRFVVFDENSEITKMVTYKRSNTELKNQLLLAENMADRYDAITALRKVSSKVKKNWLLKSFETEKFWGIRAEIARQLSKIVDGKYLAKIYEDKNAGVRKALIQSMSVSSSTVDIFVKALSDSSYVTVETAFLKIMKSNVDRNVKQNAMDLCSLIDGHKYAIKIAWLEQACTFYKDDVWQYRNVLIGFGSNLYEFTTRTKAFSALSRLDIFTKANIQNLLDASLSNNRRLANPARSVYKGFIARTKHRQAAADFLKTSNFTQDQLNTLKRARLLVD